MSFWGKILGGAAGFAFGGPLGAILGAAAGHYFVDKDRDGGGSTMFEKAQGRAQEQLQAAFLTAVVVLAAKLAKADGVVTRAEINTFKRIFNIPGADMKTVGKVFNEAKNDAQGYEPYAKQIAGLFRHQPAVLEELLSALFAIAMADGVLHPAELKYLENVAHIFGINQHDFDRIKAIHAPGEDSSPYEVLGVSMDASDDAIKKAYRKLIREHHPDRLVAQGMPEEMVEQANEKMAAINAAYDKICKIRGIN